MTELSRNLIAAAREGLAPDPAVAARVRARVAAAVGAPVVATPTKATAKSAGSGLKAASLKIGIATVLAVGAVVTVIATRGDSTNAATVGGGSSEQEPTSSPRVIASEHVAAPAAAATTRATAPMATLAREVELIDRAMLALRNKAAGDALDAIAVFDRETRGHGQMAEDAAAIAIEAHCALHHDVTGRLAAFDHTYPTSAQRSRLTARCQ